MKKLVALLVAAALMLSCFALADLDPAANTFPVTDEPVKIDAAVFGTRTEVIDWETNWVTLWWEDKLNIDIVWNPIPGATANDILSGMLAAGDLPDVMYGGFNKDTAVAYGAQGYLMPLNDLIDKWGYNVQRIYAEDDQLEGGITAPDGNIYFLPIYLNLASDHTSVPAKMLMNTKWLANLGLEVPNTVDELYDVLKAFKEQDANGNGDPDDEIPLCDIGINRVGGYIMQAFTYLGFNDVSPNYFYIEDGEMKASYVQDGWREGLAFMHKLFDEGLMDPETFVNDAAAGKMLTGAENGNRVGATEHYAWSGFCDLTLVDRCSEFEFIPPLENADGVRVTPGAKAGIYPRFFMSADTDVAEAAFRWADAQLSDQLANNCEWMSSVQGPEGEGWRLAEEGEVGTDRRTPAKYKLLYVWGQPNNINLHETQLLRYNGPDYKLTEATEPADGSKFDQNTGLTLGTFDLYQPYAVYKTAPNTIMFTEDEVAEAAQLKSDVETYVKEAETAFITGTKDIETEWDAYLAELNNIGFERLMELYSNAYIRQFGE